MKKCYVAVPAKDGKVDVATLHSLLSGMRDAMVAGYDVIIQGSAQTPVEAARNVELVKFLETDATDLFFVDGDLCWGEGDFLRLLQHPVDFVGGVYPHRVDTVGFPVQWKAGDILRVDPATGLAEVNGLLGGFMRLKRTVVEKMVRCYEHRWYHEAGSPTGKAYELFDHELLDHVKWSEDFIFCKRWREMGGTVWLDLAVTFGHIGNRAFIGNLGEWLKNRTVAEKPAPLLVDRDGAMQHFYRTVPGWFGGSGGEALYSAAVKWAEEGSYFVEIGAWKGCSAAYMGVEIGNSQKLIAFDVVDHFKGSLEPGHTADPDVQNGTLRAAFERFTAPVKEFITGIVEDDSGHASTKSRNGSLDFVFIDGGHDENSVAADIAAWRPKLKPNGIIAGDDIDWPGVQAAVRNAFPHVWLSGRCWFFAPDTARGEAFLALVPKTTVPAVAAKSPAPTKPKSPPPRAKRAARQNGVRLHA